MSYRISTLADLEAFYVKEHLDLFEIFNYVLPHKSVLARFLNSFSYMEFLGCKGLINALDPDLSELNDLLQVLEESKHAVIFRRLAEKASGRSMTFRSDDLIAKTSCHSYVFKRIFFIKSLLKEKNIYSLHHLADYNSAVLEARAIWLLRGLQEISNRKDSELDFREIIKDEEFHIAFLEERIQKDEAFKEILISVFHKEMKHFSTLLNQLKVETQALVASETRHP